jgi:hypothetical protein
MERGLGDGDDGMISTFSSSSSSSVGDSTTPLRERNEGRLLSRFDKEDDDTREESSGEVVLVSSPPR